MRFAIKILNALLIGVVSWLLIGLLFPMEIPYDFRFLVPMSIGLFILLIKACFENKCH